MTAPGQPHDNITSLNTEDTGPWRVLSRAEHEGRIQLRIAADRPEHAERIARKAIDQHLDRSPVEVKVTVVDAGAPGASPVAQIVWQRPAHLPPTPPRIDDPRGSVASDRIGSPRRALGLEGQ